MNVPEASSRSICIRFLMRFAKETDAISIPTPTYASVHPHLTRKSKD